MRSIRDILLGHERADTGAPDTDALRREFKNADEIMAIYSSLCDIPVHDGVLDSAVVPVRTSKQLYVKKHTTTQRPYYHTHDFYELIFVTKGKTECLFPGKAPLKLKKREALLLAPGAVHAMARSSGNDCVLKTVIPEKYFITSAADVPQPGTITKYTASAAAEYYLYKLLEEGFAPDDYAEEQQKRLLGLLLTELKRGTSEKNSEAAERVKNYLAEHDSPSLDELADKLGYSKAYLSRVISEKTGVPFRKQRLLFKLEKAKKLLAETDMPVEDVANEAGYTSRSGFWKKFTEFEGITPLQYRNSLKK